MVCLSQIEKAHNNPLTHSVYYPFIFMEVYNSKYGRIFPHPYLYVGVGLEDKSEGVVNAAPTWELQVIDMSKTHR